MKHIVVTGTSRGIGLELAQQLSEKHKVLALSRQVAPQLLGLPNVTNLRVDLTTAEGLQQVVDYLTASGAQVDTVIHNAGALLNKPFEELTQADFLQVYSVNVFAVAQLTQKVLPYMNRGSHVLTISSMGGVQGSAKFPGLAAYSSSKGAVITLSELLAEEYKSAGISFNVLALGAVQTEMLQEAFPGYQAPVSASQMASYIAEFALSGHQFYNGKVLQVSSSTP